MGLQMASLCHPKFYHRAATKFFKKAHCITNPMLHQSLQTWIIVHASHGAVKGKRHLKKRTP
eukprot:6440606-Amphidinium_carterae.1